MNKWGRRSRAIGVTVALLAGTFASMASTSDGESSGGGDEANSSGEKSEADDVTVTGCSTDSIGWGQATLRVRNNSSKASDYSIEIAFESSGGSIQLATGYTFISNLEPGQSTVEEVSAVKEMSGEFKCRIIKVDRWASL